jgi:hypothetical protein
VSFFHMDALSSAVALKVVNGGGKVQRRAVADGRPKSVAPLV